MNEELRDGREIEINTWNFEELSDYCKNNKGVPLDFQAFENNIRIYPGFHYFNPHIPEILADPRTSSDCFLSFENYTSENNAESRTRNQDNHRILIAKNNDELCGIVCCTWLSPNKRTDFYRYVLDFIDVREDFRGIGLGTILTKHLDMSDFLRGKILEISHYSNEGRKYIKKVFETHLTGKGYQIIFP